MKNLFICLVIGLLFFGCYEDDEASYKPNDCTGYSDLCGDQTYIRYYICCSEYSSSCWWEVGEEEYYDVDYMFEMECD